jgi:hypothetical protein
MELLVGCMGSIVAHLLICSIEIFCCALQDSPAPATTASILQLFSRMGMSEEATKKQTQLADVSRQAIDKLLSAQRQAGAVLSR